MTTHTFRPNGFLALPALAAALLFVSGCDVNTQGSASSRLARQGFTPVSADIEGAARAFRFSGNPGSLVVCKVDGKRADLGDRSIASKSLPGRTIVQDGTLDAYAIVNPDGTVAATYVLTLVREVRDSQKVLVRDIETFTFDTGTAGRFRETGTCRAT